jgi:hypothetical protein
LAISEIKGKFNQGTLDSCHEFYFVVSFLEFLSKAIDTGDQSNVSIIELDSEGSPGFDSPIARRGNSLIQGNTPLRKITQNKAHIK